MASIIYANRGETPWEQERELQRNRNPEWEKACVEGINSYLPRRVWKAVDYYIDEYFRPDMDEPEELCAPKCMDAEMPRCSSSMGGYSAPSPARGKRSLDELLRRQDAGFSETLLKLIDSSGSTDPEIYKRANISRQLFSKIRNNLNYRPTKETAIALALALELDVQDTNDLIGRAGYTLTNSSRFDLIIRYFIEKQIFNIVEINLALYEFDQPLLGA